MISELELEQALPELRLGALDLVISDEYDGHPRARPAAVRFELRHLSNPELNFVV